MIHFRQSFLLTCRSWLLEEEEIHSDIATRAMAFRLLRLNGYNVSSGDYYISIMNQMYDTLLVTMMVVWSVDCLIRLGDVHYFSNTLQGYLKDVNTVLELYKASQIKIYPNEQGLDKLASWSRMFLKEALITNQNLGYPIDLQEVNGWSPSVDAKLILAKLEADYSRKKTCMSVHRFGIYFLNLVFSVSGGLWSKVSDLVQFGTFRA